MIARLLRRAPSRAAAARRTRCATLQRHGRGAAATPSESSRRQNSGRAWSRRGVALVDPTPVRSRRRSESFGRTAAKRLTGSPRMPRWRATHGRTVSMHLSLDLRSAMTSRPDTNRSRAPSGSEMRRRRARQPHRDHTCQPRATRIRRPHRRRTVPEQSARQMKFGGAANSRPQSMRSKEE